MVDYVIRSDKHDKKRYEEKVQQLHDDIREQQRFYERVEDTLDVSENAEFWAQSRARDAIQSMVFHMFDMETN
jgi:hypothetical protein